MALYFDAILSEESYMRELKIFRFAQNDMKRLQNDMKRLHSDMEAIMRLVNYKYHSYI